ncbi:cell surface protein [Halarchaeum sp. P4]|uniref:cell surface protein n=1 Tax=Halarchaeum sp. P4 TaxID=3421639 RepID=UPI003EBDB566
MLPDSTDRPGRRVAVALATLAVVGTAFAVGTVGAQPAQQDVALDDTAASTQANQTTAPVVLTAAPKGLAGYYLRVSVEGSANARIANASYPDRFGLTTDPRVGEDGRTVVLEAADLDGKVQPGATNVTLARLALVGATENTTLTVEPVQFDTDNGSVFQPSLRTSTPAGDATTDAGSTSADATAPTTTESDAQQSVAQNAVSSSDGVLGGALVPAALGGLVLLVVGVLVGRRIGS